jgi:hypothetical protein
MPYLYNPWTNAYESTEKLNIPDIPKKEEEMSEHVLSQRDPRFPSKIYYTNIQSSPDSELWMTNKLYPVQPARFEKSPHIYPGMRSDKNPFQQTKLSQTIHPIQINPFNLTIPPPSEKPLTIHTPSEPPISPEPPRQLIVVRREPSPPPIITPSHHSSAPPGPFVMMSRGMYYPQHHNNILYPPPFPSSPYYYPRPPPLFGPPPFPINNVYQIPPYYPMMML